MSEVTLRDYIETRIKALEERVDVQRRADRDALRLQAQEYERRLAQLNNEHTRIAKIVSENVDRKEWNTFREQIIEERGRVLGETNAKAKAAAILYSGISFVAAVAASIIASMIHK